MRSADSYSGTRLRVLGFATYSLRLPDKRVIPSARYHRDREFVANSQIPP